MLDWQAMDTLSAAHVVGLDKLAGLEQAARDLQEGRTDGVLEVLKDALELFEGELELHFRHEELALFPALAKVIGRAGPVGAMLAEHESIWNAVDRFGISVEDLAEGGDAQVARRAAQAANHIVFLLRGHIQREDTMLFPLAASTLDDDGKREVDRNMDLVNAERTPLSAT